MSKHHIFEYRSEQDPGGKKKVSVAVNGLWIIVGFTIIIMMIYSVSPKDIAVLIRGLIGR